MLNIPPLPTDYRNRVILFKQEVLDYFWQDYKFSDEERKMIYFLATFYVLPPLNEVELLVDLDKLQTSVATERDYFGVWSYRLFDYCVSKRTATFNFNRMPDYFKLISQFRSLANHISHDLYSPNENRDLIEWLIRSMELAHAKIEITTSKSPSPHAIQGPTQVIKPQSDQDHNAPSYDLHTETKAVVALDQNTADKKPVEVQPLENPITRSEHDLSITETPFKPTWVIEDILPAVTKLPELITVVPDSPMIRESVTELISSSKVERLIELLPEQNSVGLKDFAFHQCGFQMMPEFLNVPETDQPTETWFVGDVHGDVLGLVAAVQTFEKLATPDAKLVFLGDIIDRGSHDIACLTSILNYIRKNPGKATWLMGNHDNSIYWNSDGVSLNSRVSPCEFLDVINRGLSSNEPRYQDFANRFIGLTSQLPRAVILGKTLAAHGGFPHTDCLEHSADFIERNTNKDSWRVSEDDNSIKQLLSNTTLPEHILTNMKSDFVHNRFDPAPYKIVTRMGSQCRFGYIDFRLFLANCHRAGLPIENLVRGHDHVTNGKLPERLDRNAEMRRGQVAYEGRVLTINNLSYNHPGEGPPYGPPNPRYPVLARLKKGETFPQPIVIYLDEELVNWYCGQL